MQDLLRKNYGWLLVAMLTATAFSFVRLRYETIVKPGTAREAGMLVMFHFTKSAGEQYKWRETNTQGRIQFTLYSPPTDPAGSKICYQIILADVDGLDWTLDRYQNFTTGSGSPPTVVPPPQDRSFGTGNVGEGPSQATR
ncbi:MAG: hypothetical protein ACRDD1_22125 [Planctomycetia bacterium]